MCKIVTDDRPRGGVLLNHFPTLVTSEMFSSIKEILETSGTWK